MSIIEKFDSAPAAPARQVNFDPVAIMREQAPRVHRAGSGDLQSALQKNIYAEKNAVSMAAYDGQPPGKDAPPPPKIKDMSQVDEKKIAKDDIQQQADWLLWKASKTTPGKDGSLKLPIPENFALSLPDKLISNVDIKKQYEDAGYTHIRKSFDDRGRPYLGLSKN